MYIMFRKKYFSLRAEGRKEKHKVKFTIPISVFNIWKVNKTWVSTGTCTVLWKHRTSHSCSVAEVADSEPSRYLRRENAVMYQQRIMPLHVGKEFGWYWTQLTTMTSDIFYLYRLCMQLLSKALLLIPPTNKHLAAKLTSQ